MSANEKFNSAMVFESQLDNGLNSASTKAEEQRLQKIIGKATEEKNIIEQELEEDEDQENKDKSGGDELELDYVN